MKKILLILFFSCSLSVLALAQNAPQPTITIQGTVIDSVANKPMGFVTVAMQNSKTHAGVKSSLTKDDGSFSIKAPAGTPYEIAFVFIGYKGKTVPVTGNDGTVNVGKILLSASTGQLKEVAITAAKPLAKREVDRISYDVQADPESKSLSALDMMRKVPLLTVDGNDNIQLKGSGSYKILINGKESAMMAKNPSDILKSMPATNVEKIEVITTPPAKYDAEGLAGIINIITKKNADQGYNIGVNGRYNSVFGPGFNINGTMKQGKFGMAMFAGFGKQKRQETTSGTTQNIFATNTNINQGATNSQSGDFHYLSAELSYEIDTLNLLTGSIDMFGNNQDQGSLQNSLTDSLGITKQAYTLNNNNNGKFSALDLALNYQMGFKSSKDKLLTLSYKYSYSPNKQFNDNMYSERVFYPETTYPDFQQYNNAGNKEHTVQLDYASPLTRQISVEAGAKAILRNNYSYYHVNDRDPDNGNYVTNDTLTDNFNYQQNVYSVYNSYQLKFDKWTGKAGLRLEHTDLNLGSDYNNLIPSVSIQRNFKTSSLNFGFTQRIQRPGIFQLNPFVDKSNPLFVSTGNPELRPELNNTFELNYSNFAKNSINLGLSYAFSNNSIQNVSSLQTVIIDGEPQNVTYTTYENLGTNKTLGLNVNTSINFSKHLSLNLNGQVNYVWLTGTFGGHFYKNDGITGNAFGNLRYKFDNGFALGILGFFNSGGVTLQGESSTFIFNQYLVSKEFLNKKLTVSLVANNPYSKYNTFRTTTTTADFYQTSYNENYYRSFAIRFNFRFGKLNGDIKKNQHGIQNDDTKGGNRTSGGNQ